MRRAITHIHTFTLRQHLSAESLPGIDCTFRTVARACFPVVTCRQSSTHGRQPQGRPCATSVHTRYCLPLSTPPNQQTPRNHCASYAIPSRWERRRDLSWCMQHQPSGSRQHQMARHPPTSAVKQNTTRLLRLIMSAGGALQTMRSLLLVTLSHLDSYAEDHPRVRSLAPRSC